MRHALGKCCNTFAFSYDQTRQQEYVAANTILLKQHNEVNFSALD